MQFHLIRVFQTLNAFAIANGWRMLPAEDVRANGEMQLIDETGAKDRAVDFTAAFAEQALHVPFPSEPGEGGAQIDFVATKTFHVGCQALKCVKPPLGNATAGEHDDRGGPLFEDAGVRVDAAAAA